MALGNLCLILTCIVATNAAPTTVKNLIPSDKLSSQTVNIDELTSANKGSQTDKEKTTALSNDKPTSHTVGKRSKRDTLLPLDLALANAQSPIDALGLTDEQWGVLAQLVHRWEAERQAQADQLYGQYMNRLSYELLDDPAESVELVPVIVEDDTPLVDFEADTNDEMTLVPVAVQDDDGSIYPLEEDVQIQPMEAPINVQRRSASNYDDNVDEEVMLQPIAVVTVDDDIDPALAESVIADEIQQELQQEMVAEEVANEMQQSMIADEIADELQQEAMVNELADDIIAKGELQDRINQIGDMLAQQQPAIAVPVYVV